MSSIKVHKPIIKIFLIRIQVWKIANSPVRHESNVVFLKSSRTAMTSSVTDNLNIWKPSSICVCKGFFSALPNHNCHTLCKKWSLTLLNMCQTLFMRVKLFKRPIYKRRKSSSALTHVYSRTQSWVLGQVWLAAGSIWALICNSRLNPRVHLSETSGAQAAILISPSFSQRRWAEGRGGTRWRH